MSELEVNQELVQEVRALRANGGSNVDILRFLSERGVIPGFGLILYLSEAFGLPFSELTFIGGWAADGSGELSDDTINTYLDKIISSHL